MTRTSRTGEILRFAIVTLCGLTLDLGIVFALVELAHVPAAAAMASGLLLAAAFNYAANEIWVFSAGRRSFSARRAAIYGGIVGAVLLTRVVTVSVALHLLTNPDLTWLAILSAIGLSFCVNYLLSRLLFTTPAPITTEHTS